jgi:hypothetical protein
MKTYELQTYNRTAWKIDSMFDDADMAIEEARRVEESRRYSGIRVIEEIYDEATNRTTTRTIFRGGLLNQKPSRTMPPGGRGGKPPAAGRTYGTGGEPLHHFARAAKRKDSSLAARIAVLFVGIVLGVAALAALQRLDLMH